MSVIATAIQIEKAISEIRRRMEYVTSKKIEIGIPQGRDSVHSTKDGSNGTVTNAQLLYIFENGAPSRNIPPTNVVSNVLNSSEFTSFVQTAYQEALNCAMLEDYSGADAKLNSIGQTGVRLIKENIEANGLVDTGQMRDSISYIIK